MKNKITWRVTHDSVLAWCKLVSVYVCVWGECLHRRIPAASSHFWDHSLEDQCAILFIPYLNSIVHR